MDLDIWGMDRCNCVRRFQISSSHTLSRGPQLGKCVFCMFKIVYFAPFRVFREIQSLADMTPVHYRYQRTSVIPPRGARVEMEKKIFKIEISELRGQNALSFCMAKPDMLVFLGHIPLPTVTYVPENFDEKVQNLTDKEIGVF